MVKNEYFWKYEPEKISVFFISQTGHGKPLINELKNIQPEAEEIIKNEIAKDNSLFRVFTGKRKDQVFVIYKKHFNTRDRADAILNAAKLVMEKHPNKTFKTTAENPMILSTLKDLPNFEFYKYSNWAAYYKAKGE